MRNKRWTALFVALTMVFTVVGFGLTTDVSSAATKAPKKITLKATSRTVDIKGKVTVSVKSVSPSNASKSVKWTSSNTRIASVSSKGVVTGKKSGKVKITATSKKNKKVKRSITITVKKLNPKVSMPTSKTMWTGVKGSIKASVGPAGVYNKGVTYRSSNTKVATVSSTGLVTPKAKGTATITAYSKEYSKYKDSCKVTVKQSITGLKFAASTVEAEAGKVAPENTLTVTPAKNDAGVVYTSSDTKVAKVDATGKVTAGVPGTATITAKTKAGLSKSASYKVVVFTVIEAKDGDTYVLDRATYSKFRIDANRNGNESILLTNEDMDNLFGTGNAGFDWADRDSVKNKFAGANFSYASGGSYIFAKSGSKVTIKFSDDIMRTNWYYVDGKSYEETAAGYKLTLFQYENGTGESIALELNGNVLSANAGSESVTLQKDGGVITAKATARGTTKTAILTRNDKGDYTVKVSPADIAAYQVVVKAYK